MDIEADRALAEQRAIRRAPKPKLEPGATALTAFLIASAFAVFFRAMGWQRSAIQAVLSVTVNAATLYVFQVLAWNRYHRACNEKYAKIGRGPIRPGSEGRH